MKKLLLIFALFSGAFCSAQEYILIDRTAKTEALFNENDPFSFLSVLRGNIQFLEYYHLEGIADSVLQELSARELSGCYKFRGPWKDIPIVETDPNSENFGEYKIEVLADGTQTFVYPPGDTIMIDLNGIERMVVTLNDGIGSTRDRMERLQLWKRYNGRWAKTFEADAKPLLGMEGLNVLTLLPEKEAQRLQEGPNGTGLWSVLRDSSLVMMEWYRQERANRTLQGSASNYLLSMFPCTFGCRNSYLYASPEAQIASYELEGKEPFYPEIDITDPLPFNIRLSDSLHYAEYGPDSLRVRNEVFAHFEKVHFIYTQNPDPLIEDDYGKANYGTEKLIEVDGQYYKAYEPSEIEVFFADFKPLVYIGYNLRDVSGTMTAVPDNLYFCLAQDKGKPELVARFGLDRPYPEYMQFLEQYVEHIQPVVMGKQAAMKALHKALGDKHNLRK